MKEKLKHLKPIQNMIVLALLVLLLVLTFQTSALAQNPAPVPQTGQTQSYGERDDGELQMGVQWPDPRFTDNGDGTVTDHLTGLIWLEDANCFGRKNWNDALDACNDLEDGDCGLSDDSSSGDWRLPNIRELLSLIDYGNNTPALPSGHPFTGVQTSWHYWSSTPAVYYGGDPVAVRMDTGGTDVDPPHDHDYVWPVRGGKSEPECILESKFEETSITVGERYYADRDYTITCGVPPWMVDRTLIQTPNDERFNNTASGYLRFKTPVSWWVYVLFDSRASNKPDWLNGWEHRSQYKISTSLKPQPYLEVWRKYFNAGQCVDLGGNFGPGSSNENRSNFVVVYGK